MSALPHTEGMAMAPDTLPGRYYYDPSVYQAEKQRIFLRSWQYVGHVSMLPDPATYIVRDIADDSIIVLRDSRGALCALSNICRHRAHRLLEGEGRLKPVITCPYHAWAYDHCGVLRAARGTEAIPDFDPAKICLPRVRLQNLCGFLFVNFDDQAPALNETAPGLEEELRSFSPRPEALKLAIRYDIPLKANWKNSVENFSECYHCPNRHKTLSENGLDLTTYKIECLADHHVHRSRDQGDKVSYNVDRDGVGRPDEFRSFFLWPNTVLEVYPGGNLTVFHHRPDGPEQCVQGIEWYFANEKPNADEQAVVDFVHSVRMEDVPICESVQKGLRSASYRTGRLVIDPRRTHMSEHAVYHFQQKVAQALDLCTGDSSRN